MVSAPGRAVTGRARLALTTSCVRRGEREDLRKEPLQMLDLSFDQTENIFSGIRDIDNGLIIPIKSALGPMRLLFIEQFSDDPIRRLTLLQFIEFYMNQVCLVDQMERDQLTSLLNRKSFETYFNSMLQQVNHDANKMWLAVMDIDHFKRVNDTYGHLYGDEVLLHFAQLIEKTFRYKDIPFRFGGEEFILLLESNSREQTLTALERFRRQVENFDFPGVGKVTVSTGFVECRSKVLPSTLIDLADKALYQAKQNGRNQIVYFDINDPGNTAEKDGEIDLF